MKQEIKVALLVSFVTLFIASCKKDTASNTTTTSTPSKPAEQYLTAHPWKPKEIRGVVSNFVIYYLRGGSANTQSFDNEYITFNTNNTGTYTDNTGKQSQLTWNFANTDKTKLNFTVQLTPNISNVTWEHIVYNDTLIEYDQSYTVGGTNGHSHETRITK